MIGAACKIVARGMLMLTLNVGLALSAPYAAGAAPNPAHQAQVAHQISKEEAMRALQERYGSAARVVRSDEVDEGGRRIYVFRLLSANGRIWMVHIDASSGTEVP